MTGSSQPTRTLSELAHLFAGGTPDRSVASYFGGGIPWVKSGEVDNPSILETDETLTAEGLASSAAKWCEPGSTLVAMYGATAGKVGRLAIRATSNQAVLCVQAKDSTDAAYLYRAIQAAAPTLVGRTQGSGQPNLNAGIVKSLVIPWPAVAVREAVSRALDACDLVLLHFSRTLAARHTFKHALLHELLTGRRRFPEFAHAASWQSVSLGELVSSVTRRNANGADERVLTCSGEHGLVDQRQFFSKLVASESRDGYYLLKRGEFAYNRSAMNGYPYGATKRLDRYESGALSTLNICFALTNDDCTSDFLLHLFESGLFNQQLGRIARVGSRAHGLLNVNKSDFFEIEVQLPSVAEQERITTVLNALDHEIALLKKLRDSHEAQKRALMGRLLSGDLPLSTL